MYMSYYPESWRASKRTLSKRKLVMFYPLNSHFNKWVPFMCLVRCIAHLAPKSLRSVLHSGKSHCITIPKNLVTLMDSRYLIYSYIIQDLDGSCTNVLTNLQSARVPTESPNSSHNKNTSGISPSQLWMLRVSVQAYRCIRTARKQESCITTLKTLYCKTPENSGANVRWKCKESKTETYQNQASKSIYLIPANSGWDTCTTQQFPPPTPNTRKFRSLLCSCIRRLVLCCHRWKWCYP